jgi:hypothetical protein
VTSSEYVRRAIKADLFVARCVRPGANLFRKRVPEASTRMKMCLRSSCESGLRDERAVFGACGERILRRSG